MFPALPRSSQLPPAKAGQRESLIAVAEQLGLWVVAAVAAVAPLGPAAKPLAAEAV